MICVRHYSVLLFKSSLGICSLVFPENQHKLTFAQKMGIKRQKWAKKEFFWRVFRIWSIKKVYINWCILAQILFLGKIWFLRYMPKCSLPIRSQNFYIDCISRIKWWKSLIFCMLIQIHEKSTGLDMVKNGFGLSLVSGVKNWLYLKKESSE